MARALPVACPYCHARPGDPCTTGRPPATKATLGRVHDDRVLADQERIYEAVKHRLGQDDQDKIARLKADREAGNPYNAYGHDLFGAVRRAERQIERDTAGEYLAETCGGNIFKAVGLLMEAYFDSEPQPGAHAPADWTPEAQAKRCLTKEAENVPRTAEWSRERRERV